MSEAAKRIVVFILIVASGLTALTASQANAMSIVDSQSVSYAPPWFSYTNRGAAPSIVDDRASRSAFRVGIVPKPPTTKPKLPAPVAAPSLSKVDIVIKFALAQRGKPYRWGAAGPNAYDCSGLVLRSFAQIHIRLPHFTGDMIHYGRYISRAQMKPGDIIFPSSHHVGIYIGHNQMIVAPHSGTVVQIQTVYAFYAARRLL